MSEGGLAKRGIGLPNAEGSDQISRGVGSSSGATRVPATHLHNHRAIPLDRCVQSVLLRFSLVPPSRYLSMFHSYRARTPAHSPLHQSRSSHTALQRGKAMRVHSKVAFKESEAYVGWIGMSWSLHPLWLTAVWEIQEREVERRHVEGLDFVLVM